MQRPRTQRRRGYTLIELLLSSAMATVIMGGLAGSLYISSRALVPDAPASIDANRGALALEQLTADLKNASKFTERTTTAVTFSVPDRDGDLAPETLRYSWSGTAGDPLMYQYNAGTAVAIAPNVQDFKTSAVTRLIPKSVIADQSSLVIFESFAEAKAVPATTTLAIPKPAGVAVGNLLIAAAAIDGNAGTSLTAPAGWTLIARLDSGGQVGLGVWWKIAGTEPANYTFAWTGNRKAYGWIMRFSGANTTTPINVYASQVGTSVTPTCPTVTTTVANALILRVGGFDDHDIAIDDARIAGYTTVTMDQADGTTTAASGGAAYATLSSVGSSATATFGLTASEEYVGFTIALAPD